MIFLLQDILVKAYSDFFVAEQQVTAQRCDLATAIRI